MAPLMPAALRELCELVGERAPRGELLQPGLAVSAARAAATHEELLKRLRDDVGLRYAGAKDVQHQYRPAGVVWKRLVYHGPIGEILRAVEGGGNPSPDARALVERSATHARSIG